MLSLLLAMGLGFANAAEPIFTPDDDVKADRNFIQIQPGKFQMGSPAAEVARDKLETFHEVELTKPFQMQRTVVTQLQYSLVMGENPSIFRQESRCPGDFQEIVSKKSGEIVSKESERKIQMCAQSPVEGMNWIKAKKFAAKVSQSDSRYDYALPTEAQWEYAARAGTKSAYWHGGEADEDDDRGDQVAKQYYWFAGNSDRKTQRVATKPANPWGLFDMGGNVAQWTADYFDKLSEESVIDPTFPKVSSEFWGPVVAIRGCGPSCSRFGMRSAHRGLWGDTNHDARLGIRLIRTLKHN